jgi:inosine-uridine nucleoside N-ribohydrolase
MTRLLIDTDPGIDDALALLYAWSSPQAVVEILTTVAGNVPVDRGTTNVFRLIALRRPTRIPLVAVGAHQPLARPLETAERHHGGDGLGDLDDWPPVDSRACSEAAPEVIVAAARRLGPQLTLVALGPLTNLALAVAADGAALARVSRVVAMGGAVDVPGNVTADAEFNMHVDPEAAARVFSAGLPLDLVPLDATRHARLARHELEEALGDRPALLATRILAFTRRAFRLDGGAMHLHDPLAVAVAIDPTLVEWELTRLDVRPDGATRRVPGTPNCRVARHVDLARFVPVFLERLCPEFS